jgi:DNA-binding NtrC family response regulator
MKTGRREVTILVIDSDQNSLAEVQAALSVEFTRIETASSLAEAETAMSDRAADLVICEINAGCVEGDIFDSTHQSCRAAQILFLSAGQQAAVAFREFSGRPCFCLRKQACRDLLLLIAKQALQRKTSQDSSADKVNRPNIPLPTLTYPSVATNIHSLY